MIPCPPNALGCSDGIPALDEPASVCRGIGHATCQGGSFPLNAFGTDFLSASHSWTAGMYVFGKKNIYTQRLQRTVHQDTRNTRTLTSSPPSPVLIGVQNCATKTLTVTVRRTAKSLATRAASGHPVSNGWLGAVEGGEGRAQGMEDGGEQSFLRFFFLLFLFPWLILLHFRSECYHDAHVHLVLSYTRTFLPRAHHPPPTPSTNINMTSCAIFCNKKNETTETNADPKGTNRPSTWLPLKRPTLVLLRTRSLTGTLRV